MLRFYILFIIIGFIGSICISFFGVQGMYSLNLAFLLFFMKRHKYDERESALSQRALYMTLGIIMIILINIYVLTQFTVFSVYLKTNWVGLLISFGFIIHGFIGLILFRKN